MTAKDDDLQHSKVDDQPKVEGVSLEAVRRLAVAVAHLANEPEFFLQALTDYLLAMEPIDRSANTLAEKRYLVEVGAFKSEEALEETIEEVNRGGLQAREAMTWLVDLYETFSLAQVAGYLDCPEADVRAAVKDGLLFAFTIQGRPRFPVWQLNLSSPGKLLPGLSDIVAAIERSEISHSSAAGIMSTPQSSLTGEGRKTPVAWLRDSGDPAAVVGIIESYGWM